MIKRALKKGLISLEVVNIRDFAKGKQKQVDDYVFGLGKGMMLRLDVVLRALNFARNNLNNPYVILASPRGQVLNKHMICDLAKMDEFIFICPNYEGIDDRILGFINEEISIGNYVISSGELASFVILESIIRFKFSNGSLIQRENLFDDSFNYMGMDFLLEPLQYTRPREVEINNRLIKVDSLLYSGDHEKIKNFLLREAISMTIYKKPDLFKFFLNKYSEKIDKRVLYDAVMDSIIPS
ncbi:MAG: tRNA (guanosine(37)-N1)-methyltransferase TrmD [Candidatus Calescibacterium sp.]|nr:tRNA (guanosine(37)-N1)-methyltransferase TrmD [Candidatus Calescibacterium sp.]MCX7971661.1 tRNA (guanosine(37)-N1)-methyltransferase TrmD [bacterium]MDW8195267.1 tRNA (guanosine(37)-N1)-methyltransferase TrmD [Candidatus Calescibacterium sp.]